MLLTVRRRKAPKGYTVFTAIPCLVFWLYSFARIVSQELYCENRATKNVLKKHGVRIGSWHTVGLDFNNLAKFTNIEQPVCVSGLNYQHFSVRWEFNCLYN